MKQLLPVVILAGGLATRLRPLTNSIPKSLLLINEEPFIYHQLRLLAAQGVSEVILCVGFLGEKIQAAVGNGTQFGLNVTYVHDGVTLRGTAGAIAQIGAKLPPHFFVLYGDSYLPCAFDCVQTAFFSQKKPALMTVFHNAGQWDNSNVEYAAGKIWAYDKKNQTERMHFIDYGLGIFKRDIFIDLSFKAPLDLALVYQHLLKQEQLSAYEVSERFYEIGSFAGMQELAYYLSQTALEA